MRKLFPLFLLLLLSSGVCFYPVAIVLADGESGAGQKEIDITLAPQDILFAIQDMKPGDWAPRTIAVKNTGSKDIVYQMSVQNNGAKKLFKELMLEISVGEKELYQGRLADFTSLPARKLPVGNTENLTITIRFPEHLGNDFQGTDSKFDFIFTAEGSDGATGSVIISGEVGNDSENAPETTPDSTDDGSGSMTPDEPSKDNDPNSTDEPSSDSDSVPPGELPGVVDSTTTEKSPATSILPVTSTNIFNLLLFGSVLVFLGIVLMLVMHYRRLKLVQK